MTAYRYVRTGRLAAEQVGGHWQVDPRDLADGARSSVASRRVPAGTRPGHAAARRRLESRLVEGDEGGAWSVTEATLAAGAGPDEFLIDVLGSVMQTIGDGWSDGVYAVDDEHRASAVALRLIARLGARFPRRGPRRRSVILGTPTGELHGLPTAMAANVLRGRGFRVIDLGADVPADSFASAVTKTSEPLAVAVAVTVPTRARGVRDIVAAVRATAPGLPVLAGGRGLADREAAERLGARWSGRDAVALAGVLDALDTVHS